MLSASSFPFAHILCLHLQVLLFLQTVILDGKTGTKLWSLNSTLGEHSSDLVLRTKDKNRDAFVFRVQGISAKGEKKATEKDSAENKQRKVKRAFNFPQN